MGNIVTINSNAWRLPFNFKILFLQAEKLSEFLFKRWWFLGNDLTLIREGTKRSCLYILLYYCLVTLVTFPNIYLGLIFWILFFKIRTGFCSVSTFSWPGVTFFCMSSVGIVNISLTILAVFELSTPRLFNVKKAQACWS